MKVWTRIAIILSLLAAASGLITWKALNRPSKLPEFDTAEFSYWHPDSLPVGISGVEVAKLRAIFESVPADRRPSKRVVFGELQLLKGGSVA